MATGTRLSNTQEELLRKLLPQISEMKLSEDADPEFIAGLEDMLVSKIREPIERVKAANLTAAQGSGGVDALLGGLGGAPGADVMVPPDITQAVPGGGGGLPPELLMALMAGAEPAVNQRGLAPSPDMGPSIDELRRVMSQE